MGGFESLSPFQQFLADLIVSSVLIGVLAVVWVFFLGAVIAVGCISYAFFVEGTLKSIQRKRLRRLKIDAEVVGRVQ